MTKDEALKLALDALENGDVPTPENVGKNLDAITAIKEALAQPEEAQSALSLFQSGFIDGREKGLKEALAQPEQEPVATLFGSLPVYDTTTPQRTEQEPVALPCCGYADSSAIKWNPYSQVVQCHNCGQVYTHPPQRTWVGLEGEEIRNLWEEATKPDRSTMTMVTSFAKSIEAKLKEKNGYAEEKNT